MNSNLKVHLCWTIGVLTGIIIILVSVNWDGVKDLAGILSFALGLTSLVLAIVATVYGFIMNNAFAGTVSKIESAAWISHIVEGGVRFEEDCGLIRLKRELAWDDSLVRKEGENKAFAMDVVKKGGKYRVRSVHTLNEDQFQTRLKSAGPGAKLGISRVDSREAKTPSRLLSASRGAPPADIQNLLDHIATVNL
jgi:hypothetical protein